MSTGMKIKLVCERVERRILEDLENATVAHVGIIDDPEIATIASYQEYGWVQTVTAKQAAMFRHKIGAGPAAGSTLTLPARPFFRGTIQAESKHWADTYKRAYKVYGPGNAHKALLATAMKAAEDIRQTLINGGTSLEKFPDRAPLTKRLYAAEAAGHERDGTGNIDSDQPLIKSGALLNSIGYQLG